MDGHRADELQVAVLRSSIAAVPQDLTLLHDTIANNILLGRPGAQQRELEDAAGLAEALDFILATPQGFATHVGDRGLKLSGGQRQRIALARALIRRPALLILDEATSMLDVETEAAVLHNIRNRETGCTTLMVAHRLSTARRADRIVVLDSGVVTEQGTHDELVGADGVYARLWKMQARDMVSAPVRHA